MGVGLAEGNQKQANHSGNPPTLTHTDSDLAIHNPNFSTPRSKRQQQAHARADCNISGGRRQLRPRVDVYAVAVGVEQDHHRHEVGHIPWLVGWPAGRPAGWLVGWVTCAGAGWLEMKRVRE